MKKIPSETVCDWFYVFFWIYVALGVLLVILTAFSIKYIKMPILLQVGQALFSSGFLAVNFLFAYIICDRGLLAKKGAAEGFANKKRPAY